MRKKSRTGGIRLPDLTLSYKSLVIKNNMVLAQKQKYKSMGQDRMSRKKKTYTLTVNYSMTKGARPYNGEKTVSLINTSGKNGQLHIKDMKPTFFNTIHKN